MFLAKIVFAVLACTSVTKNGFVFSSEGTEEKKERPLENHTFVALLDILFVDGTKRRCTGTIIHDNAIITAAHCFLKHGAEYTDVELSGSFIVVGTKKMFDTGYENYLPIERIITHPKYRGWTADLALVLTFAGLTTDKTGHVIPIVEENESTPVDSNVTILSWGNYCDEQIKALAATKYPGAKGRRCTSSEEGNESCEPTKHKPLRGLDVSREHDSGEVHTGKKLQPTYSKHRSFQAKVKSKSSVLPRIAPSNSGEVSTTMNIQKISQDNDRDETKENKETKASNEPFKPHGKATKNGPTLSEEEHGTTEVKKPALSIRSPYLMPAQGKIKKKNNKMIQTTRKHRYEKAFRNESIGRNQEEDNHEKEQDWSKVLETVIQRTQLNKSMDEENATQSFTKSRRTLHKHPPAKENKLTVETFGFVNVQTCKKLIDKALPKLYKINTNEVVCYAAEEHFISDDDSGAPAIREGRLVAVTVGGAECEGDHVAIGMKMTCFCSWIVENLPPSENQLKCCTDCCGEENNKKEHKKKDENKDATYLRSSNQKNKSRKKPKREPEPEE